MANNNLFGPGHYATTRPATSRPTQIGSLTSADKWFAQCDPANPDSGTNVDDMFLNMILANLRQASRTAGLDDGAATADNYIAEAMARYASRGRFGLGGGTANAQTVTALGTPAAIVPTALFDGMIVEWVPSVTNTAAATLAAWGLTAKNLKDESGVALAGYEVVAGNFMRARYVLAQDEFRLIGIDANRPAVATTSGTSIDFTAIPAWARRLTLHFSGVSTSGVSNPLIQIGDSGGIETTGYLGAGVALQNAAAVATINYTTGFGVPSGGAANVIHGKIDIDLMDAATNTWSASGTLSLSNAAVAIAVSGIKATSAILDRVRLTTVGGTDTFDAGSATLRVWR